MAEATAADGQMKDLSISETKKSKKDGNPQKAAKKPQQQKKKIEGSALIGIDVAKETDLEDCMISYYDVAGCYILEPSSYAIWENIKSWFDGQIKTLKVRNAYFPIFISADNLEREKEHVEGFAAEVAWVTKGGKSHLEKPVAVRPTSETAMYPYFARKIQSHRDLPLKLNQWNNVVRWEFKREYPTDLCLDCIYPIFRPHALHPIAGFIPATGRGIQAATSHALGQHFSKMFNITVEDPTAKEAGKSEHVHVWQNSWGLTTRSIGVMILTHGDNRGLVIPRVAEIQVVVIPVGVTAKMSAEAKEDLYSKVKKISDDLTEAGVRVETDYREGYSPGWKFNDWGFGPKDAEKGVVTTSRRDIDDKDAARGTIDVGSLAQEVPKLLEQIQKDMLKRLTRLTGTTVSNLPTGMTRSHPERQERRSCSHCEGDKCEDEVKAPAMGAKSLCIPFDQPEGIEPGKTKCINPDCQTPAKQWILFGRSY
ncbi:unnamed protein product [Alternaria alternata]